MAIADSDAIDFIGSFFGVLHAGATAVPLPPLEVLRTRHGAVSASTMRAAGADIVVGRGAIARRIAVGLAQRNDATPVLLDRHEPVSLLPAEHGSIALVQFTSGSTGPTRGVRVDWTNLESNIASMRAWMGLRTSDSVASWLPLHHDMGLVGLLLTSVCSQIDLRQMQPRDFLRDPATWLKCFDAGGSTLTASPNFAYGFALRRVRDEQLRGIDLSGWRGAIAGAERLTADALGRFAKRFAGYGFEAQALRPAYGLAEATLAVTGHQSKGIASVVEVKPPLTFGRPVSVAARRSIVEASDLDPSSHIVSSGTPLDGIAVYVSDGDGRKLPMATVGEIVVCGRSVARGYVNAPPGVTRFERDCLYTGDTGFVVDGEVFVIGRIADSLKVRGRHVWAETVEVAIAHSLQIPVGRCAVTASHRDSAERVVAVVESAPGPWAEDVARVLRLQVGPSMQVAVYSAPRGAIPRTSSGKVRRRRLWEQIQDGRLPGERVLSSAES